jgi:hypothetical protein
MKITVEQKEKQATVVGSTITELLAQKATGVFRPVDNEGEEDTLLFITFMGCIGSQVTYFVWNRYVIFAPVNHHNAYWNIKWYPVKEKINITFDTTV